MEQTRTTTPSDPSEWSISMRWHHTQTHTCPSYFFLNDLALCNYAFFFWQYTFAATCSSIVSVAMAERTTEHATIIYPIFITGIVYPVVVYWCWDAEGWLYRGASGYTFTVRWYGRP